jgi:MFS family permease
MAGLLKKAFGKSKPRDVLLDLLTFDRLMTKPVIHLIYWAGLGLMVLSIFGVVGGAIGIALREEAPWGWFLALPFLVGGVLFVVAGLLLWRSFCEFYVAIFRIADDLRFLRTSAEQSAPTAFSSKPSTESSMSYETRSELVVKPTEDRAPDVTENPFTSFRQSSE